MFIAIPRRRTAKGSPSAKPSWAFKLRDVHKKNSVTASVLGRKIIIIIEKLFWFPFSHLLPFWQGCDLLLSCEKCSWHGEVQQREDWRVGVCMGSSEGQGGRGRGAASHQEVRAPPSPQREWGQLVTLVLLGLWSKAAVSPSCVTMWWHCHPLVLLPSPFSSLILPTDVGQEHLLGRRGCLGPTLPCLGQNQVW